MYLTNNNNNKRCGPNLGRGVGLHRSSHESIERREHTQFWHVQFCAKKIGHRRSKSFRSHTTTRVLNSRKVRSNPRSHVHEISDRRLHTRAPAQLHGHLARDPVLARPNRVLRTSRARRAQSQRGCQSQRRVHIHGHRTLTDSQRQGQDEVLQRVCQSVRLEWQGHQRHAKCKSGTYLKPFFFNPHRERKDKEIINFLLMLRFCFPLINT